MTKTDWTAEEVRTIVKNIKGHVMTVAERADMFDIADAFAERIEADESAVPVAKVRHFNYSGIARNRFSQEAQMLDGAPELPDGTALFTHPPKEH